MVELPLLVFSKTLTNTSLHQNILPGLNGFLKDHLADQQTTVLPISLFITSSLFFVFFYFQYFFFSQLFDNTNSCLANECFRKRSQVYLKLFPGLQFLSPISYLKNCFLEFVKVMFQ